MNLELLRTNHSIGEANYHIQITVAYRKPVFEDGLVKLLVRDYILAAARRHGIAVSAIGFGIDHCHLFATDCKNFSPSKVAQILKGFSSFMMRKHHRSLFENHLWGDKFWSSGYFYRTVGVVNAETVKTYVEHSQEKHWKIYSHQQKNLYEFSAS